MTKVRKTTRKGRAKKHATRIQPLRPARVPVRHPELLLPPDGPVRPDGAGRHAVVSGWLKLHAPGLRSLAVFGSVALLLLTTLFWAVLSARIHSGNADQLVDAYMFESAAAFNGALFPGTHSFLLKWPVFVLMAAAGNSLLVFEVATVLLALVTVGVTAYVLYRINPRPLVFSGLCLAMASVLLMVPTEPYAGALLPTNFAMTTTRNIEYLLLLGVIYCALRARSVRNWWVAGAIGLTALLVASDKLYTPLLVGGAAGAGLWFYMRSRGLIWSAARLLVAALAGILVAWLALYLINLSGLTTIAKESAASPFALLTDPVRILVAAVYGVLGVLTNLGANPVTDVLILRDIPAALASRLFGAATPAYAVNLVVTLVGLGAVIGQLRRPQPDIWSRMVVVLAVVSGCALGIFILTDHYYPVDSRYLTVWFFLIFMALAVRLRTVTVPSGRGVLVLGVLLAAVGLATFDAYGRYEHSRAVSRDRVALTRSVADTLHGLGVTRVIGDYWYVMPVKARSAGQMTAVPVDPCTTAREVLNSRAWYGGEFAGPTAYLAVRDSPDGNTYGGCTVAQISGQYGVPTNILTVPDHPKALLLIYGQGAEPPEPATTDRVKVAGAVAKPRDSSDIAPIADRQTCAKGTTLMIAAHQDDDLLFMNPDMLNDIESGRCIRAVFLTAGDAGSEFGYWYKREQGSRAAYARMFGVKDTWRQEYRQLAGQKISVRTLQGVPRLSVVSLRLPDGGLHGQGYERTDGQSLRRLQHKEIESLGSIDGKARYDADGLVAALAALLKTDRPDVVRTQYVGDAEHAEDHSDHQAAGYFTQLAVERYKAGVDMAAYLGYSQRHLPVNLSPEDIARKQDIFFIYAAHDKAVCASEEACAASETYGNYLLRQYRAGQAPPTDPLPTE